MARLEARSKGGYYPTPQKEMKLVCQKFTVEPDTRVLLLDPCAGKGEALKMLADHLKSLGGEPVTYGIEIEETRAEECKKILDHAVKCDYNQARTSTKAFSVLWLNPPYDILSGERVEVTFLRDLTDPVSGKLMVGGILGFCIPQYVLKDAAPVLAARFDDLSVYRFTDDNYPIYKQVVVFGIRRSKARRGEEAKRIRQELKELAEIDPAFIPTLDILDDKLYHVPEAPDKKIIFRGSLDDPKEIAEDIKNSPVWDEVEHFLLPYRKTSILKPPVLPLKPTHDAIAIAAGAVGGNLGSHLLVGRSKKVIDKKVIPEEKGEKIIETERYITTIRVFASEGVFNLE